MKTRIAVFASGSGSNAENLVKHFEHHPHAEVVLILCNNPEAGVLERAKRLGVDSFLFNRQMWKETGPVLNELRQYNIDLIVLAGFLWLVPEALVNAYHNRIINIHPALLPKYGGKGMYGSHVHMAVKANRETETGITIHYVDNRYDEGAVIFQKAVDIDPESHSHEEIAEKVHALEYEWFPKIVEQEVDKLRAAK